MSTSFDFIDFVIDQVSAAGNIRTRKMFGEFMLYCDDRPVLLVCDDTVFVKKNSVTCNIFKSHGVTPECGIPYPDAKEHYIVDIENAELAVELVREMRRITPIPKPRKKTRNKK